MPRPPPSATGRARPAAPSGSAPGALSSTGAGRGRGGSAHRGRGSRPSVPRPSQCLSRRRAVAAVARHSPARCHP
ncbi:hypothetical protein CHLRE_09g386107v5 [Chlamydomonas reinhardtii]|uniref:Uncharacterized protein n=1 Tax=Chlamydomonas reinhardtii TaxID=3055 RepID=A0A2K3DCB8_CHLRE|nr:uncharacterized protein CHLRE_09g386107v5 [Chlamydomonas reinhardtii]XP_042920672.1 uncharacterized protein CHLRE_09g386107v5 [Chlamydomonas reinhardtii]PNW78180.1 hypothetical protein CHLRE_09g386107v5 [Chlamydomonas reinhardtii]PNW78181.1 hypothetical protein CHLRE_09g386107v5 [Chlamydomonas reinhardtii]